MTLSGALSKAVLLLAAMGSTTTAFIPSSFFGKHERLIGTRLYDVEDDWKAFRDKLINQEKRQQPQQQQQQQQQKQQQKKQQQQQQHPSHNTADIEESWAVEQNKIEAGSILVHTPSPSNIHGLNNQYLYKSVLLVLEVNPDNIVGLLLNRPTDVKLQDDATTASDAYRKSDQEDNSSASFSLLYGGDHSSLHSDDPLFYCLQMMGSSSEEYDLSVPTMMTTAADIFSHINVSNDYDNHNDNHGVDPPQNIMPGLRFINVNEAKQMCATGQASASDFCIAAGFVACPTEPLLMEFLSGEWKSLRMDAKTLEEALSEETPNGTWEHMLELTSTNASPNKEEEDKKMMVNNDDNQRTLASFDERMLEEWSNTHLLFEEGEEEASGYKDTSTKSTKVAVGQLLRSSSHTHAFLFDNQEFHKSLMLVLQEDDDFSVAVLLNHPTGELESTTQLPIRYGGNFDHLDIDKEMAPFCVHRLGGVIGGEPVGDNLFWKASIQHAEAAIEQGLAQPMDFLVVRGLCIWNKKEVDGLDVHVEGGMFDIVDDRRTVDRVWEALQTQYQLTVSSLPTVLKMSFDAWRLSGGEIDEYSEDTKVHKLGLDALGMWMAKNLLAADDA